jgi:hypothetical protein
MKKIIIFVTLLFSANYFAQDLDFSGFARYYAGYKTFNGSDDMTISQATFNFNVEKTTDFGHFKINPMLYFRDADSLTLYLREAYLDIYFDNFDLRIGKQQVIWGKADGVFITDIVSPKNLNEFLLPEFDEIRIGITAVKLDYYVADNHTIEAIWTPIFNPTVYAPQNSIWHPQMSFGLTLPNNPPIVIDRSKEYVKPSLENSEFYLKYSALTSAIDFEIMGAYMWDDDAALGKNVEFTPVNGQPVPTKVTVVPEYHRLSLAGGSFSTTLGPFVLRGEAAYYFGKYFQTKNPMVNNGLVEKDYIHYLIGVDFTLWDINFSGQFIQKAIMDYKENELLETPLFKEQYNNMATFLAHYSCLNETLTFEYFMYYDFNYDDALIRPRILYDYSDSINLQFGVNIFTGTEGLFGQYNQNDMVYAKIYYNF